MVLDFVRAWWSAPADYEGMVTYFRKRGLGRAVQVIIAACSLTLASVPLAIQTSPAGPSSTVGRTISIGFAVAAIVWGALWLVGPWPSRTWSILFVAFADIGIGIVSMQDSDPLVGMFGANAFILVSVYAIFFDGSKLLAVHTIWVVVVILTFGAQIATGPNADLGLAAAKTIAAIASVAITPPAIHIGIWILRNEANESTVDPLTGLLNRRGLQLHIGELDTDAGEDVVVIVADLDKFKAINDVEGHAVGDEVLIRTARRIKASVRGTALVTRLGGEEFAVVDVADRRDLTRMADRIRLTIGAPADRAPITASLGAAYVSSEDFGSETQSLDDLLQRADQAMYEAKRRGRNATVLADAAG